MIYLEISTHTVPLSLSHVDGTMQKTPKATLMSQKLHRHLHRQLIPSSLMPHFSSICRRTLPFRHVLAQ